MRRTTKRGAAVRRVAKEATVVSRAVRRYRTYNFLATHDGRMYSDAPDEQIMNQIERYGMIRVAV